MFRTTTCPLSGENYCIYATLVLSLCLSGVWSADQTPLNLYAPHFHYIGQAFRYSPENALYIFSQQIYFII